MRSDSQLTIDQVLSRGVAEILPGKEGLKKLMSERKVRLYLGIDPTGSLLTLGHSVVLRKLQQFSLLGHEVILLIGSGTVRIGDPTGKDSTRPELTDEQIKENFKNWKAQASQILDFEKIKIVYNGDWLDKLSYADLVKLMAKTTVQQLIERDMFQERLKTGKPIFGHEIMYPLLQGYDSVHMDVDLEIGGTDQTFNMMMGRHLQRVYNNKEKWVLTTPIINGTDGRKMSKSYGNFVALTEEPRQMYGKLMSIADEMILDYFALLTDVPEEQLANFSTRLANGENPMELKKQLAFTLTEQYHTTSAAQSAQEHFEKTVQDKSVPDDIPEITVSQKQTLLEVLQQSVPEESNSNLRRLVEQGGVTQLPENIKHTDPYQELDISTGQNIVLKIGKRRFVRVRTSQ
ncbi:tyrosine--tRNA ligase [Candidatus Woesebacteria bacterium]|nr:tyrosine--tRNA ligase [Candidatus Woesebacteria bacterium]